MTFQKSEKDSAYTPIVVRPYHHPDDFDSVRRIFELGNLSGSGSPYKEGVARFSLYFTRLLWTFTSGVLILCAANVAGLRAVLSTTGLGAPWLLQACGGTIMLASALAAAYYWYYFRAFQRVIKGHVTEALGKDLSDIVKEFKLRDAGDGRGLMPTSASGFWVAEDGYEVVGCAGLDHMRGKEQNSGEVRRLAVSPFHRRRGVGAKLMDVVVAHGRASGLDTLTLGTSGLNIAAIGMYTKDGWELEKKMIIKDFGIPLEVVMYRKKLI